MTLTPVRVGVMDSARPGLVVQLQVRHLGLGARVWRGLKRLLLVSAVGVLLVPVPLLHLCGVVVAVVVGPIWGVFAFLSRAVFEGGDVACPKCAVTLAVPKGLPGWPARVHCVSCGAMVELNPAEPT